VQTSRTAPAERSGNPAAAPLTEPPATAPAREPASPRRSEQPVAATAPSTPSFQPLLDARVGEVAEYHNALKQTMRYEVIEAHPDAVVLRITMIDERGAIIGQPTRREERRDTDPLVQHTNKYKASVVYRDEAIEVAGKRWEAILCDSHWKDPDGVSLNRKTWVSAKVPVLGLLRMEMYTQEGNAPPQLDSELELFRMSEPTPSG
jgi:hypothetical protein